MSRLLILGATGSLGGHVLRQALAAGHDVTVFVRTPSKLPPEASGAVSVHTGDLGAHVPLDSIKGQDALINCAGHVADGETFVAIIDRLVTAVDSLAVAEQPACWFLAGAALLDLDSSGRRGVDLPKVKATYWPHRVNFERLGRSRLDWRLLCPGPMVEEPALGLDRLRISIDAVPVLVPAHAAAMPAALVAPVFASLIPQMIVAYADAAGLMLANLDRDNPMARHRVGLALPVGMRGRKSQRLTQRRHRSQRGRTHHDFQGFGRVPRQQNESGTATRVVAHTTSLAHSKVPTRGTCHRLVACSAVTVTM